MDLAKFMIRLKGMEELVGKDIFKNINTKAKLTKEENAYLSLANALGYISCKTIDTVSYTHLVLYHLALTTQTQLYTAQESFLYFFRISLKSTQTIII